MSIIDNIQSILVLAPHTDDGELGCGGSLNLFLEQGRQVTYVAFSTCEESVPEGFPKDVLATELKNALQVLGLEDDRIIILDYPVRRFSEHRQSILEKLVQLSREIQPELVFLPNSFDVHQDHMTVHSEGLRAFKRTRILGYELPWNAFESSCRFHIRLREENVTAKIDCLSEYKSQANRFYFSEDYIRALCMTRGHQLGANIMAESFENIRWFI